MTTLGGIRWAKHILDDLRNELAPALAGLAEPQDEEHAKALLVTVRQWLREYDNDAATALTTLPPARKDINANLPS